MRDFPHQKEYIFVASYCEASAFIMVDAFIVTTSKLLYQSFKASYTDDLLQSKAFGDIFCNL